MPKDITPSDKTFQDLFQEIKVLVDQAKTRVIAVANSELVLLNWNIGRRIKTEIIKNPRADYGEEIVATLSQQLQHECGRGFTRSGLFRMVQFYESFPDGEIVATLSR